MQYKIRPSKQRLLIMEYLLTHKTHPSVDDIYFDLRPNNPTLSRTTIYNTLKLFNSKKAILALSIDGHCLHYDGDTLPHAHFQCTSCQKIFDVPTPKIELAPEFKDFTVTDTQVFYWGICPDCQHKMKPQSKAL